MEEQKLYDLSSAQRLNFMSWRYTLHKQIMNIPTSMLVEAPLDLDLLKKAVEEAIRRNDSFGVRITRRGKEVKQFFTDRKPLLLETLDFTGRTESEMDAFFQKTGEKAIPLYDQPLAKIYIVKAPDGACGLFTCICHLMMDTWAIGLFYKDVMAVYRSMKDGTPMPAPIMSSESVLQKELEYMSSNRHEKDLEFWRNEILSFGTPPKYTHINGQIGLEKYRRFIRKPDYRFGRTAFLRTTASHEVRLIGKQDVDDMMKFCQDQNFATPQSLFFLGIRCYLAHVNDGADDISIFNILARRSTLEEKQSGGTRPLAIVCRTVFDGSTTFSDALRHIVDKQTVLFRHANISTEEVIMLLKKEFGMKPYEGFCTFYLTYQPMPMDVGPDTKMRSKWYCNGAGAMSIYANIMDDNSSGALRCYYEYLNKIVKPERVGECHDYIVKVIRTGMENPSITLNELANLAP